MKFGIYLERSGSWFESKTSFCLNFTKDTTKAKTFQSKQLARKFILLNNISSVVAKEIPE